MQSSCFISFLIHGYLICCVNLYIYIFFCISQGVEVNNYYTIQNYCVLSLFFIQTFIIQGNDYKNAYH